jgi:PIN domain nuclease of toxin-antitoxin system
VTYLLDTHVLLWSLCEPGRFSAAAADDLRNPDNTLLVSAVSGWEIAIKQSLGKLVLPGPADVWLPEACLRTGIGWLPVTPADALAVGRLPWHHRDPFDRLLVAQVRGGIVLFTHDRAMEPYGVPTRWA